MEPPSPEMRDWAALPRDILFAVFLRLGPCEIMHGAELVCTTWRRVAVDEPALWRRVDMGTASLRSADVELAAARVAVTRGAGQCEAFTGCSDDDLLLHLVERAPSLKSLHLLSFDGSIKMLNVALKKLPLLEDLEIAPFQYAPTESLLESVCKTCPLLRALTVKFTDVNCPSYNVKDYLRAAVKGEIPTISELRSLQLIDCYIIAEGLITILDNCPVLESLHITGYFDDEMDAELRAKCARVKNLTLPYGCAEGYDPRDGYVWDMEDELYRRRYGHDESRDYESWEMPFHPQYHFLCDDLDYTDYGFPFDYV